MPPNGVGGGGVHWNAETWRFLPSDFVLRSHLTQRYGSKFLPQDMTIQDWGITYDELEAHYDRFEYLCGTSGTAGNLNGKIQAGGNPFEGPRSRPYPTPAQQQPFSHALFGKAAAEIGYKPFPQPSGNLSQAYTNPLNVRMGPCTYCGFCEWFGCGNYSKASPQTTLLPVLLRKANFEARDLCEVTRINTDSTGKRATGVTFVDASGNEFEQPADLVILSAFTIFNVQLLLLSKIGTPYDPVSNKGVIGRNFTHQTVSDVESFFDKSKFIFNPFIASGAIGMCIDEFNGDNFDHGPHGFVGGGYMGQVQTNGRPIQTAPIPPGTPKWGAKWKDGGSRQLSQRAQARHRRSRQHVQLPRRLRRPRSDLPRPVQPAARPDHHGFPRQRDQAERVSDRQVRRNFSGDGRAAGEQDLSQGAVRCDRVPNHAPVRWGDHGNRSQDQRGQPILPKLGRSESVRPGSEQLSAERGLQPHGHRGCARFLVGTGHPQPIPQEPRAAGAHMRTAAARAPLVRIVAVLAVSGCAAGSAGVRAATYGSADQQNFAQIERGRYLTRVADCAACHAGVDGTPFAGGRPIETPFGVLDASNITPDGATGIGHWSDGQFDAVLREGRMPDGSRVYPAMPYPYYTKMSRADVLAIRAYLNTVPPVHHAVESNQLPFPFRMRSLMAVWDALYFKDGRVPRRSLEVGRMESRRLPRGRSRALRRVPYTEDLARGR